MYAYLEISCEIVLGVSCHTSPQNKMPTIDQRILLMFFLTKPLAVSTVQIYDLESGSTSMDSM